MKRTIYIVAFLAISFLSGCQLVDVLDKKPSYEADLEGAITNAKTAELALIGVYSYLPQGTSGWMDQPAYSFRTGMMSKPSWHTSGNAVYYYERNWPTLGSNVDSEWDQAYNIIKNANFLLTRVDAISDFQEGRRETMKGELYFLKGFAYHRLLIRYGQHWDLTSRYGMILRENTPAIGDDKKGRATVQETYDLILENLDQAITMAPKYSDSGYGSSLAAKATKVKVLMDMGKYEDCAKLADEVLKEAYFEPVYDDVFTKTATSKEVIFARKFGDSEISNMSTRLSAIDDGNWAATRSLDSILNKDPRKKTIIGDSIQVKYTGIYSDLYKSTPLKKLNNESNSMPIIFLRTAEIYLIKAEAIMRGGGSIADAWAPIMVLRTRAGATSVTPTSREQLEDAIFNEWICELSCENGSEWMAVRRVGVDKLLSVNALLREAYQKQVVAGTEQIYRKTIVDKRILSIPDSEINSNPVEQNPGY